MALAMAVAAPALHAQPASGGQALPRAAVDEALALVRSAAESLAPAGARIEVEAGALDARLRLAQCRHIEAHWPANSPAWGRTRVGLRCTEGVRNWHVFLPVTVRVMAPGWVGSTALPAGTTLAPGHLRLAEVDWAESASAAFGPDEIDQIAGRPLSRALTPGQALRHNDLQLRRWFSAGQTVRIVMAGNGYAISAQGRALNEGIEGREVRVRTEAGRVLTGRPVGDGVLEVTL
jgi:flagellar basal body P-ring formation protein FlgA